MKNENPYFSNILILLLFHSILFYSTHTITSILKNYRKWHLKHKQQTSKNMAKLKKSETHGQKKSRAGSRVQNNTYLMEKPSKGSSIQDSFSYLLLFLLINSEKVPISSNKTASLSEKIPLSFSFSTRTSSEILTDVLKMSFLSFFLSFYLPSFSSMEYFLANSLCNYFFHSLIVELKTRARLPDTAYSIILLILLAL